MDKYQFKFVGLVYKKTSYKYVTGDVVKDTQNL